MNSILVLIDTPPLMAAKDHQKRSDWRELLTSLKDSAKTAKGVEMLAENLWQIDARKNLPFLVELLHGVGSIPPSGLPYKILPLEEGQSWISPPADA
jgi:hypothetical protein